MDSVSLGFLRKSAVSWGLWKVLDHLLLRYYPEWWPQLRGVTGPGLAALGPSAPAAALDLPAIMRGAPFADACRELGDSDSPVLRALTRLWAADAEQADGTLDGLSLEETLVVLTVLAQAGQSGSKGNS